MDSRLPVLKDFKAVEAEPVPPESLVTRLFSYVFITMMASGLFAGAAFLQLSGVFDRSQEIAQSNLRNVEESNSRIYLYTKIAAITGAAFGVVAAVGSELKRK